MSETAPEVLLLKDTLPARKIAETCSEPDAIAKYLGFTCSELAGAFYKFNAVYVVSPEDIPVAKVGVAVDPGSRLTSLQCGNWNPLYLRAVFWCAGNAYHLESAVKAKLAEMDAVLLNEWAALSAEDLAIMVAKMSKEIGMRVADCRSYLDSWIANGIYQNGRQKLMSLEFARRHY